MDAITSERVEEDSNQPANPPANQQSQSRNAKGKAKRPRKEYSSEELTVLKRLYFDEGVNSYGSKENQDKVAAAAEEIGCDLKRVKIYITNRNTDFKKTLLPPREPLASLDSEELLTSVSESLRPRATSTRGAFMKVYLANRVDGTKATDRFANGSEAWGKLRKEDKQEYVELAARINAIKQGPKDMTGPRRKARLIKLQKEIQKWIEELESMNVETTTLMVDTMEHKTMALGTEVGLEFIEKNPTSEIEFLAHCIAGEEVDRTPKTSELRKQLQTKLNSAYSRSIGKQARMPYLSIDRGDSRVHGLPEGFGTLTRPSCYGREKLEQLLKVADNLTFTGCNQRKKKVPAHQPLPSPYTVIIEPDPAGNVAQPPVPTDDGASSLFRMETIENDHDDSDSDGMAEETAKIEEMAQTLISQMSERKTANMDNCCNVKQSQADRKTGKGKENLKSRKNDSFQGDNEDVSNDVFEVEEIMGSRIVGNKKNKKTLYLIKWQGYDEISWEPEHNIIDKNMLEAYILKNGNN